MKYSKIIAIDPDVEKSGVAIMFNNNIIVEKMNFVLLTEYLKASQNIDNLIVVIEAGWLNKKSNFTLNTTKIIRMYGKEYVEKFEALIATKRAKNVGENHETGRKIVEFLKHYNIPYKELAPLNKHWKGTNKKITKEELNGILERNGFETFKSNNQDERDATLILLSFIGKM